MSLLQYVHPTQGTDSVFHFSNGNTLPLTAFPFGMSAWSPQTSMEGKNWFFNPNDRHFFGMRLTHQPSPWIGDYGHLLVMPQSGSRYLEPMSRSSSFRPEDMVIKPDYFKVNLLRYQSTMELSPTIRGTSMRIHFADQNEASRFIVTPFEGESSIQFDAQNNRLTGYTRANNGGAPNNFAMYFVLEFDCDINLTESGVYNKDFEVVSSSLTETGEKIGAYVGLTLPESGVVHVNMGTSFISIDQAIKNLKDEIGGKSFEDVRNETSRAWEEKLSRIQVEDEDEEKLHTFYTCMYRTCLFPRTWYEYNEAGEKVHYSPYSGQVHPGPMYSDIGFWDVYRSSLPLYTILHPSLLSDMLEAWVNVYKEGGWMPKWSSPGERSMMPGTLIDVVFADAYVKGIRDFDVQTAYEGLLKHATQVSQQAGLGRQGVKEYTELGYLPAEHFHESVNNALDYIYGDFCIAQIAKGLGKNEDYELLIKRSMNYKKLFDPSVGFMRAKNSDGSWQEPFDPLAWGSPYCEGGAWQCSWAVQHDFAGLAEQMGGKETFVERMNELLTMPPVFKIGPYGREIHEMSEMAAVDFGQFAISNQPSFHIPYIFAAMGQPADTQYWVRKALDELFSYRPDGLPGDEDNGSLAAWYIFGAMGLYPLSPGVPEYIVGSPLFKRMTLHLEDGKQLVIEAEKNSSENIYVDNIQVNEEKHEKLSISHEQLLAGGTIRFAMTNKPSEKKYDEDQLPFSLSTYLKKETHK